MDASATVLSELAQIKLAVYAILLVVTVTAVGTAIRAYAFIRRLARKELGDLFRDEAQDLLERGVLDKLMNLASGRIAERPNDVYAHWYLAHAHRLREEWERALEHIQIVGKVAPEWERDYVKPFVQAVEDARGDTRPANLPLQPPPASRRG